MTGPVNKESTRKILVATFALGSKLGEADYLRAENAIVRIVSEIMPITLRALGLIGMAAHCGQVRSIKEAFTTTSNVMLGVCAAYRESCDHLNSAHHQDIDGLTEGSRRVASLSETVKAIALAHAAAIAAESFNPGGHGGDDFEAGRLIEFGVSAVVCLMTADPMTGREALAHALPLMRMPSKAHVAA